MAKIKFYYLPKFHSEKTDGAIGALRDINDSNVYMGDIDDAANDGNTVIIAPASKRQIAKADKELLEILKQEGNKKES